MGNRTRNDGRSEKVEWLSRWGNSRFLWQIHLETKKHGSKARNGCFLWLCLGDLLETNIKFSPVLWQSLESSELGIASPPFWWYIWVNSSIVILYFVFSLPLGCFFLEWSFLWQKKFYDSLYAAKAIKNGFQNQRCSTLHTSKVFLLLNKPYPSKHLCVKSRAAPPRVTCALGSLPLGCFLIEWSKFIFNVKSM